MKLFVFYCVILLMQVSCNSLQKNSKVYVSDDCDENFRQISFSSLVDSMQNYDKVAVSVSGYYSYAFETSALSSRKNINRSRKLVWIDFTESIVDSLKKGRPTDENIFERISGKKVRMKGIVYADEHGHLGAYEGTLKHICYLEVFD